MAAAAAAKEKGNVAFKAANYELALAHYSTAMQLDPSAFTFPLNRCMTYLKLEKWKEAEKDATLALKLEPVNPKALFRRGLARKGLGKLDAARADFMEAKVAGAGVEVNKELAALPTPTASRPPGAKQSPATDSPASALVSPSQTDSSMVASLPATTSRLKAAITPSAPVTQLSSEDSSPSSTPPSSTEFMREVSTRRTTSTVTHNGTASSASSAPLAATSFAEKKQQRNGFKHTYASTTPSSESSPRRSPTLHPSTSSTHESIAPIPAPSTAQVEPPSSWKSVDSSAQSRIERLPASLAALASPATSPLSLSTPSEALSAGVSGSLTPASRRAPATTDPVPMSTYEPFVPRMLSAPRTGAGFEQAWFGHTELASRLSLLKSLDPSTLPSVFQASLTPDLLSGIVDVVGKADLATDDEREWLLRFLKGLVQVQRFGTLVGFLDESEKNILKKVFAEAKKAIDSLAQGWEV